MQDRQAHHDPSPELADSLAAPAAGPTTEAPSLADAARRALFIVGAPRCGTTALSKHLAQHPQVCFSKPKETHFFLLEPDRGEPETERRRFLARHFPELGPEHAVLADGSVSYLYAPQAIARALRAFPEARFVVGLRNPADLVRSYHARMVYMTEEDVEDFERAWDLQEERAAGRMIPRGCREPRLLQYREVGRLATHLERLQAQVGRERVLAYLFDDFVQDPHAVYAAVLRFAGLPLDEPRPVRTARGHQTFERRWLRALSLGKIGVPMPWLIDLYLSNAGWLRPTLRPLRRLIKQRNTVPAAPPAMPAPLRARLTTEYAPEVERLERLLGRDLSAWQQPAGSLG
jgi:hypothetical protein